MEETVLQEAAMACDVPANIETVARFLPLSAQACGKAAY
jgi:hypothetical protein